MTHRAVQGHSPHQSATNVFLIEIAQFDVGANQPYLAHGLSIASAARIASPISATPTMMSGGRRCNGGTRESKTLWLLGHHDYHRARAAGRWLMDVQHVPQVMVVMRHLGYPPYFTTILGIWKVLGALALVVPLFPRLKEWAYAGLTFELTGAAASHAMRADGIGNIAVPLIFAAIALVSWALRPQDRMLGRIRTPSRDEPGSASPQSLRTSSL